VRETNCNDKLNIKVQYSGMCVPAIDDALIAKLLQSVCVYKNLCNPFRLETLNSELYDCIHGGLAIYRLAVLIF
jgi:hypothetical protein